LRPARLKQFPLFWALAVLSVSAFATDGKDARAVARERDDIRQQLKDLRQSIKKTHVDRSSAAKALSAVEKSISESNAQLEALTTQRYKIARELKRIDVEETRTEGNIALHQQRLAQVLQVQYRRQQFNPLQSWLAGHSANEVAREGYWFERVSQAEVDIAESLKTDLAELEVLRQQKQAREDQLEDNSRAQERKKRELLAQQQERKQLVEQLSSKLAAQQKEASRLERDERRLSGIIEELARALRNARRSNEATRPKRNKDGDSISDSVTAAIPDSGDFARLRGRLQWPVAGQIAGRFGQTRSVDGGGPTWKGVFLEAPEGAAVKAVSSGRVVFSEWLRGFGQLLIVDHGDQYMSIYGNNQKLLKTAGDLVKPGETVATVGKSSGNLETGLYFELRHQGQPFDPLKWTGSR
jgi:septal ring factor EnvC (AmiA/AmiB activator)